MSDRLLKRLVAVLAVLVVAWLVARFIGGLGGPAAAPFDLAAVAEAALDSVVVAGADDTVRLHAGDGWTVNGHQAAANAEEALKRALEQAEVGALVSRNPENHERLGVTRAAGRRLTLYSGGTAGVSLIVGRRARALGQSYVRREGEDEVYTLQGTLISLVNRDVDDWRDKEIIEADRDLVQRIEYSYPDESFALARDTAGWQLEPSGAAADGNAVSGVLSILSGLLAIGFVDDSVADTLTWEPPSARLRLVGPDGTAMGELVFLEREDVGFYVRRAGSPVVYTISSHTGGQLLRRQEGFEETGSEGQE
jgi:hypothetical protein